MLSPPTDDLVGQTVGEYQVVGKLGVGGMGVVYEGRHPVIGKRVAIKVLLPSLSAQAELVQRFLAEARAVNEIRHRGIVDIFSFGSLPSGAQYFVMEYLEGEALDKLLEKRGALPVHEALAIVEEVLDALVAAHEAHVIHRDIKPSNLFLVTGRNNKSYVKLLDFGIAKLTARDQAEAQPQTRASVIMGTPDYIAPEQAKGAPITPQTDLYAVGVVLYELLTGARPFRGDNPIQTMWLHLEQAAPRPSSVKPDLPRQLDEVCLWAMEKEPANRPKSADQFREVVASLRATFARNALGSPLTPTGSPRPLSAIEGLPAGLRPPPGVPPTLMTETGAMPTARSLEPVPDVLGAEPRTERREAWPSETVGDQSGPHRLPLSMVQTVIQPPRRPTSESTRIVKVEEQQAKESIPDLTPLAVPRMAAPAMTQAESQLDLTPVATRLPRREAERSNRGLIVAAVVALVVIAVGVWWLTRPSVVTPPVTETPKVAPVVAPPVDAVEVPVTPPVEPEKVGAVEPTPEVVTGGGPAGTAVAVKRPVVARPAPTKEQLEQRVVALEAKLEQREQRRGEPDRMLRRYLVRVRGELEDAESEAERRAVSKAIDELAGLVK